MPQTTSSNALVAISLTMQSLIPQAKRVSIAILCAADRSDPFFTAFLIALRAAFICAAVVIIQPFALTYCVGSLRPTDV